MLRQRLQQKNIQKLSPQQIQFIKLLQIPTVSLDARIKDELESNPALEDLSLTNLNEPTEQYADLEDQTDQPEETSDDYEEFSIEDYIQEDNQSDYDYDYNTNNDSDDNEKQTPIAVQNSFTETLYTQLRVISLNETDLKIGQQIIGSLDDDGYLRRSIASIIDDLAFSQNMIITAEEVEKLLGIIQSFDPAGIAARDLQECLLLQLRKKKQSPVVKKASLIIANYLDEITKKHYEKLEKQLAISSDELKDIIQEILKLNPKPGDINSVDAKQLHVIPDFYIANNNGTLLLTLNSKNAPDLRISKSYQDMFEHYDRSTQKDKKMKEAVQFVKHKLDAARWFIDAIKQRQQTLLKTMNAIINYQHEYFLTGDEKKLKPMILKDIADHIAMDISTISRVVNSKYVQTPFGTFLLKFFFSEAIQTDSGEEVSNKEVKKILTECINKEDKQHPLSDEKLTDILIEKGYNIARRTVAKYREELNIPVARLRKEL